MTQTLQDRITQKLAHALQPIKLEVVNDSARHAGHAGDNGSGESHFTIVVVSAAFEGKGRVERQRMVYDVLSEEISHGIHALSMKTVTGDEYVRMQYTPISCK